MSFPLLSRLLLATALITGVAGPSAAADLSSRHAPTGELTVKNLGWDFVRFIDATADLPLEQRVARFKTDIVPLFPEFYAPPADADAEALARADKRITKAIENFPRIRAGYEAKLTQFDAELSQHLARFRETFPGFVSDRATYLLHSLGQMDGGTRDLAGKRYLIFGADMMAAVHKDFTSEAPFFHHELFHVLHEAKLGPCEAMWCSLWIEGLATYVAGRLNQGASEAELLLTFPDGMAGKVRERLADSWVDLATRLDSQEEDVFFELFSNSRNPAGGDLPLRRGYYLGYLVAQEIGRTHDLRDMAAWPAEKAAPIVKAAVEKLARQGK
ncbi:hypothetical protein [Niveispirillum sp.]|uniref:hypothetical protein n=1 Tax=Niveispirillum sp. TaxID=1917217 RepID=UPI001B79F76A|nr:hypothetical protein [Niveispirillum sp.]MBP7338939.1 hypothetical protein [Niveispirillum sp.]